MMELKPVKELPKRMHGNIGMGRNQRMVKAFYESGHEACEIVYEEGRNVPSVANKVSAAIRSSGLKERVKVKRHGVRVFLVRVGDIK